VTALQTLPPRQVAVLILRDVLGFSASEVADLLGSTVESVTSALKRARAGLRRRREPSSAGEPPPAPGSPAEDAVVARFVSAWESAGIGHAAGLYVLTLAGDRICAMTRFETGVLSWFGLPRSLPGRGAGPAVTELA
jgi:sigma-70-like protein